MDEIITVNSPDGKSQKFLVIEKVNRDASTEYLKGKKYLIHPNMHNVALLVKDIEDATFEDIQIESKVEPKVEENIEPKVEPKVEENVEPKTEGT